MFLIILIKHLDFKTVFSMSSIIHKHLQLANRPNSLFSALFYNFDPIPAIPRNPPRGLKVLL